MTTDLPVSLVEGAQQAPQRVILPEPEEPTILRAARSACDLGVAHPVLLGSPDVIRQRAAQDDVSLDGLEILQLDDLAEDRSLFAEFRANHPTFSDDMVARRLRRRLSAAAVLLGSGRVDALVAGLSHTTAEVIIASLRTIGLQPDVRTASSLFLMRVPGYQSFEGDLIVFADCAVVVNPDARNLADIAITTARTTRALLGWEPRIAMLSFSTLGSGGGDGPKRVREATAMVRDRVPDLAIEGELQLDAAITPAVAARKITGESHVAGRANILIFPDLHAGNIAYKAVQRFAGADAFGPFMQGFARTVCDLSRGSTVSDVVGVIAMASLHAARTSPAS